MQAAQEEAERIRQEARQRAQEKTAAAARDLGPPPTGTYADETKSVGVDPPSQPVKEVNGPTPTAIPGGKVLTTVQLWEAIANKSLGTIVLIDVSSEQHPTTIPSATRLPTAGLGTMDEQARKTLWEALKKLSGDNWDVSIIFFGRDAKDWEGYNAALRAIDMGYSKVYWYRGGIAAWTAAHQPLK
jgi:PQQ-dependent catabolism-associated CXXCW motif protein